MERIKEIVENHKKNPTQRCVYWGGSPLHYYALTHGKNAAGQRGSCMVGRLIVKLMDNPPPDENFTVRYSCKQGRNGCVNPAHMSWEATAEGRRRVLDGKTFSKLTVIRETGKDASGARMYLCQCECGRTTIVRVSALVNGSARSCGCEQGRRGRTISAQDVAQYIAMRQRENPVPYSQIGRQFGVSPQAVHQRIAAELRRREKQVKKPGRGKRR